MDSFDKRAIFYVILILIVIWFFMFPYSDRMQHWNNIYKEAQRTIEESKSMVDKINTPQEYKYSYWLEIDARGAEYPSSFYGDAVQNLLNKHYGFDDILVIKVDSISLQWFDTIVVVKNGDTIKIALEDL